MTHTLYWLTLSIVFTGLLWVPYVLDGILKRGLFVYLGYAEDVPPLAPWAQRAKRAHANAVENLALFAPLVLVRSALAEGCDPVVDGATIAYLVGRVAHYFVYVAKIPMARTLTFFVGYVAAATVAVRVLALV